MSAIQPDTAAAVEETASPGNLPRLRSLLSFLLALGILAFFASRLELDLGRVLATIGSANPLLFVAGFAVYYLSFPIRAVRWRSLLQNVGLGRESGVPMPSAVSLTRMLFLGWFANCVIPAKLGDAYRGFQLKQATRVSFSTIMGTILAERLMDMTVLVLLLITATFGLGGLGDGNQDQTVRVFEGGLLLLALGVAGLGAMWALRGRFHTFLPHRLQAVYLRFQDGTLGSFRQLPLVFALSLAVWIAETSRLFLVVQSLGLGLSIPFVVFLALANSLLTVVPFTPGGLGLAEAGIVGLLLVAGVDKETAVAAALLDRSISYWSIVGFGFVLFVVRRRL